MIGVALGVTLLWIGGLDVLNSNPEIMQLESQKFVRFIIFLFALLQPARKIGNALVGVQSGIVGARRAFSILDLDVEEKNEMKKEQSMSEPTADEVLARWTIGHKLYFLQCCRVF